MMVAIEPALQFQGALRIRPSSDRFFELSVPDFFVRPGEFVGVVGKSGCGKSTLLDMLALIDQPTEYKTYRLGRREGTSEPAVDVQWSKRGQDRRMATLRARRFGYVLQTGGLIPFLSVIGNARLSQSLAGQRGLLSVEELAKRLGIAALLRSAPSRLSGGQRQRAAILRALAHGPSIVLADEPTAAIDQALALDVVQVFKELCQSEGVAVVMVSHDEDLVLEAADRHYGFRLTELENGIRSVCSEMTNG